MSKRILNNPCFKFIALITFNFSIANAAELPTKELEQAHTQLRQDFFYSYLRSVSELDHPINSSSKIFILYDKESKKNTIEAERFCKNLLLAGVGFNQILFEPWAHRPGDGKDSHQYGDEIFLATKVIVIGSPELKRAYESGKGWVKEQFTRLLTRIIRGELRGTILTSFHDSMEDSFPISVHHLPYRELREDFQTSFFDFLMDFYGVNSHRDLQNLQTDFNDMVARISKDEVRDEATRIIRIKEEQAAQQAIRRRAVLDTAHTERDETARNKYSFTSRSKLSVGGEKKIASISEGDLGKLWRYRTYAGAARDRPKITVMGGGISGILSTLNLALLKDSSGTPIFDIDLIEADPLLMNGASKLICRLHLGNEYPTHPETALQCIFGATLFCQQFQTKQVFTQQEFLEFLIAQKTLQNEELTADTLIGHNEILKKRYAQYLDQIRGKYGAQTENLLFGPLDSFFETLLPPLISDHFGFGIKTKEKGLQPIGLGVILENLLERISQTQQNLRIHRAIEVKSIKQIAGGRGFEIITSSQKPLYSRYLVNATWHNIPPLNRLMKRLPAAAAVAPLAGTQVFLRTLALVDTRDCPFPSKDSSYFGLLGEEGGMVSRFPGVAALFIPADEYSYQGDCILDEDDASASALPSNLQRLYRGLDLPGAKEQLAQKILGTGERNDKGARIKFPSLAMARPITTITRTTLSKSAALSQREHIAVDWVDGVQGCLQVLSAKGTFAPFVALQAVAHFAFAEDVPEGRKINGSAREFLEGFLNGNMLSNALLPEEFILVHPGTDMPELGFTEAMRRYAFHRQLPFSIFENSELFSPETQFRAINWGNTIDLEHHVISAPIAEALLGILPTIETVKLGPIMAEDRDAKKALKTTILNALRRTETLKNLVVQGWDINSSTLKWIMPRLEKFVARKSRFDSISINSSLFETPNTFLLKKLSFVNCYPDTYTLKELFSVLPKIPHLEELDLSSNAIGTALPDAELSIEYLIVGLSKINRLLLRDNNLFLSVRIPSSSSSRYSVLEEPQINGILRAIEQKQSLRFVDLTHNNIASDLVQEALDLYFAS
jgi:hypothetical protein